LQWKCFHKETAIVFLRRDPAADSNEWEQRFLDVAASKIDREETIRRLRKLVRKLA
jgi:hypothetical protein